MDDKGKIEDQSSETAGIELAAPTSAIVDGGEWVVIVIAKFWANRNGRRGTTDPSGGLTANAPFSTEILLALPLVDKPTTPKPDGSLTVEEVKERIIKPLTELSDSLIQVNVNKDF